MKVINVTNQTRFMIFGAGCNGRSLSELIGKDRIECFIDNNCYGKSINGIPVCSLDEIKDKANEFTIVIASLLYYREIIVQLEKNGIENYIVYGHPYIYPEFYIHQELRYMNYEDILKRNGIDKYKNIIIYGENAYIYQLINEIKKQCKYDVSIGVVGDGNRIGIRYYDLEEALLVADCLIINIHRNNSDIRYELFGRSLSCDLIDIFNVDRYIEEFKHKNIEKYKDIHKGERCFLIGNGPSLCVDDLNKLYENGEVCFACNRINLIFPKTLWRPDYYAMSDSAVIVMMKDDLREVTCTKFIADYYESDLKYIVDDENVEYIHYQFGGMVNHPGFSLDPSEYTCEGGTALYDICLQMAVYMGFSEIYLLGVDNTIICDENDHFDDNYFSEDQKVFLNNLPASYIPETENTLYNLMNRCFETALQYSKQYGFKIYNATRGGRLDVLERVNFDDIFKK